MPRGFLVKRTRNCTAYSYRVRRNSEEERSDSGSEQENVYTHFGSPDSGYSQSPINLTFRETVPDTTNNSDQEGNNNNLLLERTSVSSTRSSSPLSIGTPSYGSPFYFSAFDRLTVSSPTGKPKYPGSVSVSTTPSSTASSPAPNSPSKKRGNSDSDHPKVKTPKKSKAARRIQFDEDKTSPVSGTIIKDLSDSEDEGVRVVCGDIDSSLNFVEITPEAKAELEKIENKIGDYVCMLCKEFHVDAFHLAQHKCSRIVHVEYRCPECDKVFNCPANLASHRRWHKPRPNGTQSKSANNSARILPATTLPPQAKEGSVQGQAMLVDRDVYSDPDSDTARRTPSPGSQTENECQFECDVCGKKFKRQSYLRKHLAGHTDERPFPCQYCGKLFRSETARAKHVLQHALGHKDGLNCTVCGNSFPNKAALERHQRIHSSEIFTCKYCSNTFYSSPGLTRHINKCHPSENRQVILLQLPVNRPC